MEEFPRSLILVSYAYAFTRLIVPVVSSMLDRLLQRTLRKIDSASAGRPDEGTALRQQVDNTPGRLLKLLVARALLNSRRQPRWEQVAEFFLGLGAAVIGGPEGQEYKRSWIDDLNQAGSDGKISAVMLVNAVSCFLSSFQIRWVEKIDPGLRRRFARQYRIGGLLLAAAARSVVSALFMIALPATPPLAFIGYMLGHLIGFDALGWALVAFAIIEVPHRTCKWQRERQLAADTRRRAAGTSGRV